MVVHVVVGRQGGEPWELHPVLTEELAPRLVRISLLASLWALVVLVEKVHLVNILWAPLNGIDLKAIEQPCRLPDRCDIGRTDIRLPIMVESLIVPSIELSGGHGLADVLALSNSLHHDLRNVLALHSEFEVQGLCEEGVGQVFVESLDNGEDHGDKVVGQDFWPVVLWGVDPGVEEVVVAVWETLGAEEELAGSCLVELSSLLVG